MKNIFLDTNIILDFLDKKRPLHIKSKTLISKLIMGNHSASLQKNSN